MASIQYKMVETLFRLLGVNKMLAKEGAAFDKLLASTQKNRKNRLRFQRENFEMNLTLQRKPWAV